ncbi:hypothetical protein PPRY_a2007 [Pseudoalteromonas prydzensis ACAM 620]|nr:hypothetical protein [Pseudoalteromonas prydzensis ACAM 620]MBE0379379.1 hypothetical protein [Pseudoalteromonas prydzensis ACAM 620]
MFLLTFYKRFLKRCAALVRLGLKKHQQANHQSSNRFIYYK